MIKANFEWLCKQNHIAPTTAAKEIPFAHQNYLGWTENSRPHPKTLKKIADYFGVPVESLIEDEALPESWNGALPPAPPQREIVLIISRPIHKNTRR